MSRQKRPVIAIGIDGDRREYDSVWEAHEDGFHYPKIYRCLKKHSQTHKGYHWRRPAEGKQAEPPNLEEALAWIAEATTIFAELAGGGPDLFTRRGDDFRADVHICRSRILSALISSPGKDGGQEVEAVGNEAAELARLRAIALDMQAGYIEATERAEEAVKAANALQTEVDLLRSTIDEPASTALVERLTSALQPFAQAADDIERTYGNDLPEWQIQFPQLPMSDFRRARSALSASQSTTSREGKSRG